MVKKLTKTGNSLALILDKPLLDRLGLDEDSSVELSTDGEVLVVAPIRGGDRAHQQRVKKAADEILARYGGAFERLAE